MSSFMSMVLVKDLHARLNVFVITKSTILLINVHKLNLMLALFGDTNACVDRSHRARHTCDAFCNLMNLIICLNVNLNEAWANIISERVFA